MEQKLVSVITPTWKRTSFLRVCIDMVQHQTYSNIEHIVVSDGLDPQLVDAWPQRRTRFYVMPNELGRNWSSLLHNSFGIAPLLFGMLVCGGDYQMWLSDDDTMIPEHIEKLVQLLESTDSDFVYSKCRFYESGQRADEGYDIGTDPPEHGQITNFLYRTSLLYKPNCMPLWGTHPVDIALVKQWMAAGAKWAMLDEVTFFHRADH